MHSTCSVLRTKDSHLSQGGLHSCRCHMHPRLILLVILGLQFPALLGTNSTESAPVGASGVSDSGIPVVKIWLLVIVFKVFCCWEASSRSAECHK
jgi:hypothetical protein